MMFSKFIPGLFALAAFNIFFIIKQPAPVNDINKALIGEKRINFSIDHDVIFNTSSFPFNKIILSARLGQIQMRWLKIYYLSGNVQDVLYDRLLKPGTINLSTPLTETAIQKIEFGYVKNDPVVKGKPHPHKRAQLSIWGYY